MNKHQGPRTTDLERAWAAYRKSIAALGPGSTAKELKAASKLAKGAYRLAQKEAAGRQMPRRGQ